MAAWLPWLGLGSILTAIIGGAFMFKVNRAQATQIAEVAKATAQSTALAEADKMIEYANLRYDALREDYRRCNARLNMTALAADTGLEILDGLMASAVIAEGADEFTITISRGEVADIRLKAREARRSLLHQES